MRKGQTIRIVVRQDPAGRPVAMPYTVYAEVLSDASERKGGECRVEELAYGQQLTVPIADCREYVSDYEYDRRRRGKSLQV